MDDSNNNQVVENKEVEKSESSKRMANYFEIQKRQKKVKEYLLKGYTYIEISEKLSVCYNTVRKDGYVLKERSKNQTARTTLLVEEVREKILEQLELVEKTCWQLYEKREVKKYIDKESVRILLIKVKDKKIPIEGALVEVDRLLTMKVPQESRIELLRLINITIANIAKIHRLIGPTTLNLTQINIGKVEHNLSIAKYSIEILIKDYVPEDKQLEAIKKLKKLEWKLESNQ